MRRLRRISPLLFLLLLLLLLLLLQQGECLASFASHHRKIAEHLQTAGDLVVDGAAVLGEYGVYSEDPAAISFAGCSISNAGRDFSVAWQELEENQSWESCIDLGLLPAARSLEAAAASLEIMQPLIECSRHLHLAGEVTGCINMASAAADDYRNAGLSTIQAGIALTEYGEGMIGFSDVESNAGHKFTDAAASLISAGNSMKQISDDLIT